MLSTIGIPLVILALALAALATIVFVARNYIKCPPNEVLIFSGRKHKVRDESGKVIGVRGYRLVTGGAGFRIPLLEIVDRLSLQTFQVEVKIHDAPNVDGVPITLDAAANLKVSSDPEILPAAVERLLGKENVRAIATNTLEGILREIAGTLTIEEIITERQKISQQVQTTATGELAKLGLRIDNFLIKQVRDEHGYIEALGKKKTAEVKRDAVIGEAEALKESTIKSSVARRLGEEERLANEAQIANAERDLAVKKAGYKKEMETRQAEADLARRLREAEINRDIKTREVAVEEAEKQARIKVAEQEALRKEKELVATEIKPADAARKAAVIRAEGEAAAAVKRAEGDKEAVIARATGERQRLAAEGEGRAQAEAAQRRQIGEAEADAIRAKGESEGAAIQARLLAEAEGEKARLLAEAEGFHKKNEALARMSESARAIITLELLPGIIEKGGEAGERIVGSAFEHVGTGLSRIDNLTMVDMGNGDSRTPISRFALSIPDTVFGLIQRAEALGIDVNDILKKLGIDVSKIAGAVQPQEPAAETPPASAEKGQA